MITPKLLGTDTPVASKKFYFGKEDITYFLDRAKIFLIPLAIIYIPFVVTKVSADGFQLTDFLLDQFQLGALVLYVLNRILTAGQLYLSGKK